MYSRESTPDISVVIVSYNTSHLLHNCLLSLGNYKTLRLEIIVVDNHSQDNTLDLLQNKFPEVIQIANEENTGFAKACNQGAAIANAPLLLFLNPDTQCTESSLQKAQILLKRQPKAGIVGGRLIDAAGLLQPSARSRPSLLNKISTLLGWRNKRCIEMFLGPDDMFCSRSNDIQDVAWVVGAFFMTRAVLFNRLAHFDERFFMYFEEIDYCDRARKAGFRTIFHPGIETLHIGGASSTYNSSRVSTQGSQVVKYRVASEWNYFKKHNNWLYALSCLGTEYCIRWIRAKKRQTGDSISEDHWMCTNIANFLLKKTGLKDRETRSNPGETYL